MTETPIDSARKFLESRGCVTISDSPLTNMLCEWLVDYAAQAVQQERERQNRHECNELADRALMQSVKFIHPGKIVQERECGPANTTVLGADLPSPPCQCLCLTTGEVDCELKKGRPPRLTWNDRNHGISTRSCRLEVGSQRAEPDAEAMEFGKGKLVVDTGKYGGEPAVFIAPAGQPGEIGGHAARENHPRDRLVAGEVVLTFPTETQAEQVADALLGTAMESMCAARAQGAKENQEAIILALESMECPDHMRTLPDMSREERGFRQGLKEALAVIRALPLPPV